MGRRKLLSEAKFVSERLSKQGDNMPRAEEREILHLDGSTLEGGGQLVRNAVALSGLTSQPISISNIRANRSGRQGLKASHTAAVKFLADICGAHTNGCFAGSSELSFFPRPDPGIGSNSGFTTSLPIKTEYDIRLPTPGSVFLIFQALYPYLLYAGASALTGSSGSLSISEDSLPTISLSITGGTNVSFSPSYDYVSQVLIPNFGNLGLPRLSVKLHNRGWSSGSREFGSVTFQIEPLRHPDALGTEKNAVDLVDHEKDASGSGLKELLPEKDAATRRPKFPFFHLKNFDRGTITQIDITILAPDNLVSESAPTRKGDKGKGKAKNHTYSGQNSTKPSQTVRELIETETVLSLQHAFQKANGDSNTPTLNIHTSERTSHRSRVYLLLVAHTSTGFRLGHDIGPGIGTGDQGGQRDNKKGKKHGKYGSTRPGKGGGDEEDSMDFAIRSMVYRCVRGLMSEISDSPASDDQGESENENSSTKEVKGERIRCVDKNMRDQVVVFEALGKAFAGKGLEEPAHSSAENEGGLTLHSKTAVWVCKQMLGV